MDLTLTLKPETHESSSRHSIEEQNEQRIVRERTNPLLDCMSSYNVLNEIYHLSKHQTRPYPVLIYTHGKGKRKTV